MKFLSDGMLGKLSRWLRMMGHDVKYSTDLNDDELLGVAKCEQRVLLTKDLELYQRAIAKDIDAFYVEGNNEAEYLANLSTRFDIVLEIDLARSHCPRCNAKIHPVPKTQIKDKVEKNTFAHYDEFWLCPNCGHVYWQGAHWTNIRATLNEAKEKLKLKKK